MVQLLILLESPLWYHAVARPPWDPESIYSQPSQTEQKISKHWVPSQSLKIRKWAGSVSQSVQFSCSVVSNSLRPHGLQHARPPCPSPTPRVYSNSCHWIGDAIQPPHALSTPSPPAFNLSQHQGLFKWVSSSHQVEYWSFSFNISPSNEYSGLISFRMDWLDLSFEKLDWVLENIK